MTMEVNHFNCPVCKSEATQKLSIAYEAGLSDIKTTSHGAGIATGHGFFGLGAERTKTTGTSQTLSSQKASPPSKKTYFKPLIAIWIGVAIIASFMGKGSLSNLISSFLWIAGSLAWIIYAYKYNSNEWINLKAQWDKSFICNRCNHQFEV